MECEHSAVRRDVSGGSPGPRPLVRQLGGPRGPCRLRLGLGARLPRSPAAACPRASPARPAPPPHPLAPFMSEMDEISYWIHTKRAPCLLNYDNPIKKRPEPRGAEEPRSETEEPPRSPKKRKKRKLSLLDDGSVSTERRRNIYFESQKKTRPEERRSDTLGSDVDFDIKNTSIREKRKKTKLQKNNRTTVHKKNKVITSTPKTAVNLRRSLRHNKGVNHHWNSSYEIFNTSVTNGAHPTNNVNSAKTIEKNNQSEMLAGGDQTVDNKRTSNIRNKSKTPAQNGQFDDVSDVSGFTANYIRSTKIQSNKTPRKPRSKPNRNLMKESEPQNESNMVVTVNKAVNTGINNILNCSTDSSQNLINLVTNKNNDKSDKLDKSTSLLKFMDTKPKGKDGKVDSRRSKPKLNISFQSQSSGTSRYLTRNKAAATNIAEATRSAKKKGNKNCIEFNNSDKKENPEEKTSKTRSGRNIGLSVLQRENSVLVVSNSTEPVSSMVSLNVASPNLAQSSKKKRPVRQGRKKVGEVQSPRIDSLRDRSGFAACFSESEDDSEPLVQRKYFCA